MGLPLQNLSKTIYVVVDWRIHNLEVSIVHHLEHLNIMN